MDILTLKGEAKVNQRGAVLVKHGNSAADEDLYIGLCPKMQGKHSWHILQNAVTNCFCYIRQQREMRFINVVAVRRLLLLPIHKHQISD